MITTIGMAARRLFAVFWLAALWSFRRFFRPAVVFLVYGDEKDRRAVMPFERLHRPLGTIPIGRITFRGRSGFVLASLRLRAERLKDEPRLAREFAGHILGLIPRGTVIALAGQLPGCLRGSDGRLPRPFVDGSMGTCYCMRSAVMAACCRLNRAPAEATVAVLGGSGYAGLQVVKDFVRIFGQVIAIDPKIAADGFTAPNLLRVRSPQAAVAAEVVLVLTAKGDQAAPIAPYLSQGTIVIDDTHPPMSAATQSAFRTAGARLVKAVLVDRRARFRISPPLPRWTSRQIPGCLAEAVMVASLGWEVLGDYAAFCARAEEFGLEAELVAHTERF